MVMSVTKPTLTFNVAIEDNPITESVAVRLVIIPTFEAKFNEYKFIIVPVFIVAAELTLTSVAVNMPVMLARVIVDCVVKPELT